LTSRPSDAGQLVRDHFPAFVLKCFATSHGGKLLGTKPYLDLLCTELDKVFSGETTRLIINLPPRHLKSFLGSVCFSAWWLAHRPSDRLMVVTYAEPVASNLGAQIRIIMGSQWYQQNFATRISPNRYSVTNFATTQHGGVYAVSLGGSITGYGADLLIFDDPLNINDANNNPQLQRVNESFDPLIMSRLNHPKNGRVIIIAHRLHESDLSGFLMQQGGWKHIVLPFIAPEHRSYGSWHRRKGELLRPDAFDSADIARIQANASFLTLYQQCVASEEHKISAESFGRFRSYEIPIGCPVVLSVDASLRDGQRNSYSVVQAWYREQNCHYLLDQWRSQCDYEPLLKAYKSLCQKYPPSAILIENTANGLRLLEQAKRKASQIPVFAISPGSRSKTQRLAGHIGVIQAGGIKLPENAAFVDDYVAEFTALKRAAFDQIDATTQYLDWIKSSPPLKRPIRRAVAVVCSRSGKRIV
jgi:hypothetical protein